MTFRCPMAGGDLLAVVPIFVNAGAAILPAILAPLASVAALLLRPRELIRACRRRPLVLLGVAASGAVLWWGAAWVLAHTSASPRQVQNDTDWVQLARQILLRQDAAPARNMPVASAFRYGFDRTGHDGGPAPVNLKLAWAYNPDDAMVLSSPATAGDRVFAATCIIDPIGGNYGAVFCLEAATSKPIWTVTELEGGSLKPFFSSPSLTLDGKYILIGQGLHDDSDSHLLCLEADTGKLHWRVKTPLHIESSPAILGDLVVAGAGAIEGPDRRPTTDPGFVLAVRISDGTVLWRFAVADPESSPAIAPDGTVYIGSGFQGNAVVALRSESDEQLKQRNLDRLVWKASTPFPITDAVTLFKDMVIVGGGNGDYVYADPNPRGIVVALDARTGELRWQREMLDAVLGAVAASETLLVCPVRNGEVVGLSPRDGRILWTQRISGKSPVLAAPALAGGRVYAATKDGYLGVIDAGDGRLIERHRLNADGKPGQLGLTLSSPTVAGGCVFVGSETGGLRCYIGQRAAE